MININSLFELINKKFTWQNILSSTIIALITTFIVYFIVAPLLNYSNLNDFYVGSSIFANRNKFFDVNIILLYNLFFFLIFFLNKFKFPNVNLKIDSRIYKYVYIALGILILVKTFVFMRQFTIPSILDIHHYGEQFGTYYLHAYQNMKYYKEEFSLLLHYLLFLHPLHIEILNLQYKMEKNISYYY